MKVVVRSDYDVFRFDCDKCMVTLEARGNEFEFVRPGRLKFTCPRCGRTSIIKERSIEIIPAYHEATEEDEYDSYQEED